MIGSYGGALLNLTIVVVVGATLVTGSTAFIKEFAAAVIAVFVVGLVAAAVGIKAAFESLHNPEVAQFYRRYGMQSSRFFRRFDRGRKSIE